MLAKINKPPKKDWQYEILIIWSVRGLSLLVEGPDSYYLGKYYQKVVDAQSVETVQKYYAAGSMTIALRTIVSSVETVTWLVSDHIGSTSITANADGSFNSEIRYLAFGEVRYSSEITPTNYQYTGQLAVIII